MALVHITTVTSKVKNKTVNIQFIDLNKPEDTYDYCEFVIDTVISLK